ncbi:hypothetical protein KEM54_001541, partial [Ascosphaera aggregata]
MSKQPRQQKVIKMGTGSQARVAQACDRCRSKKIRCDGKQPRCTSCASVGFECKTSDRLSRRAFPRGYTESLEQRVIALEASMHESETLIQAKDAEIEALKSSVASASMTMSSPVSTVNGVKVDFGCCANGESGAFVDGVRKIQQRPALVLPTENAPFQGPSSTRSLLYSFQAKIAAVHQGSCNISVEALLAQDWALQPPSLLEPSNDAMLIAKSVSDELVRTWFVEWAPFFPILHRPTSENAYEAYCRNTTAFTPQDLLYIKTHLSLIYAIITIVSKIYYLLKGDYNSALRYRSQGISICHSIGLHQSQVRFKLNTLETELRKRGFWCQYILDKFIAAVVGVPILLRDEDIDCELPTEVTDDAQITENGIIPSQRFTAQSNGRLGCHVPNMLSSLGEQQQQSPSQPSHITATIKLIEAASILGKTLNALYSTPAASDVRISTMHTLVGQLDAWEARLPEWLRPGAVGEKPGVFPTLLVSTERHADQQTQEASSSSILQSVESSKTILRTLQYMDRKRLNLSVCISKRELLLMASVTILWQWRLSSLVELGTESRLARDSEKVLVESIPLLKTEPPCVMEEMSLLVGLLTRREGSDSHYIRDEMVGHAGPRQCNHPPTQQTEKREQVQKGYSLSSTAATVGQPQQGTVAPIFNFSANASQNSLPLSLPPPPPPPPPAPATPHRQSGPSPLRFGYLPPTSNAITSCATSSLKRTSDLTATLPQSHGQPYLPQPVTHTSPALSHTAASNIHQHHHNDGRILPPITGGSGSGIGTAHSIASSNADDNSVEADNSNDKNNSRDIDVDDGKKWTTLLSKID